MNAADLAALAIRSPAPEAAEGGPWRTVAPNAEGVVDLVAANQVEATDRIPNPFRPKHPAPRPFREVPLLVSAILLGEKPGEASAIVNGRLCVPGDLLEGTTIAAITADAIELRTDRARCRVPMQDAPVILRVPR